MPQDLNSVEILTVEEACNFLKVKRTKLYDLVREVKDFPCHKAGLGKNASLRFFKHELVQWVAEH